MSLQTPNSRALVAGGTGRVGHGDRGAARGRRLVRSSRPGGADGDLRTREGAQTLVAAALADARLARPRRPLPPATGSCRDRSSEVTEEDWDAALDVTAKGTFFLAQAAAAAAPRVARRPRDRRGRRGLPAVDVLRAALRRQGGPGDADARARRGARARGAGLRGRARPGRGRARPGGAPRRRDAARARRSTRPTSPKRSSTSPGPRSSPATSLVVDGGRVAQIRQSPAFRKRS